MTKNKLISLILVIIMLSMVLVACQPESEGDSIVIYNWAEYIYKFEEDFQEFYYQKTGRTIDITYATFDTNETMLTRMMRGDSKVDVICPSEYAIQQLLEAEMLLPINYFTDPTYDNSHYMNMDIVNRVRDTFANLTINGNAVDITEYFVPYMYGTIGILYNSTAIDSELIQSAGWGALFNVDSQGNKLSDVLDNRIFMKDSIRDAYAATVCYLKDYGMLAGTPYDSLSITELINTVDSTLLEMTKQVLVDQKSILYGYEVDFGKNDLIMGNAYLDLAWSGDAMYAIEESWVVTDEETGDGYYMLDYYMPSTSNIWLDGWVIPKTAENVEQAKIFIDFLNSPYVASQNMIEIGYTSAVNPQYIVGDSQAGIEEDSEALTVLYETYNVYAPQYWQPEDDTDWTYDYKSTQDFLEYFFDDARRYPDISAEGLGVMRHFGENNNAVSIMWESVKSYGISAWALLGWTLLAGGVVVGIVCLVYFVAKRKKMYRIVE